MKAWTCLFFLVLAAGAECAQVKSVTSGPWSAPGTWEAGHIPDAGDVVLIRSGHRVVYDVDRDAVIRSVHVAGVLTFSRDENTKLCTGLIRIAADESCREEGFECHQPATTVAAEGAALEVGTPNEPIPAGCRALIRLTPIPGMDADAFPAILDCGGRMDFHGAPIAHTWVKLDSTTPRGSKTVEVANAVQDWRPGDKLLFPATKMSEFYQEREGRRVIPPLEDDSETETAELVGASAQGMLLKSPLQHDHLALGRYRGEVANLSRNVVIESADPAGIRGHTAYQHGSSGSISYAEFRHLGKKGALGRYPIHFHLCGDSMRGASVIGASVWDSDNRWITLHGSNFILVRDCVGFRSTGHGYFFEDGTEVGNVLDHNLAVQALMGKPLPKQMLPFDTNDGAGFWWANCANSFTRNTAADCGKFGYRFQMTPAGGFSTGMSVLHPDGQRRNTDVRTLPFIRFDGNEAHSQRRFALNLGGFHGQSETADLDRDGNVIDRTAYLGGDVMGVGPDYRHPFQIRDFLVWGSHWGFHSTAPNVRIDGFEAHDVNYVFWRSNAAGHDYNRLNFSDIRVSTFFNSWGASSDREAQLRYVEPVDDTPPVTLVTGWKALDDTRMEVNGVTVDDGTVRSVTLNGEPATLVPGPMNTWSHVLPIRGDRVEITATAEDTAGNREANPHHLALARSANGWSRIQLPISKPETSSSPAVATVHPPLEIQEASVDSKDLPWPLWDGTESVAAYASRTKLEPARTIQVGGVDLQMQLVPAGSFIMGGIEEGDPDEKPLHRVFLTQPFYLGKYELTQRQYQAVMGRNPSCFQGPNRPVEQVSWLDAAAFLKAAGNKLRLPTEAEWEFACRAGTASAYANGGTPSELSQMGWWGRSVEGPMGNSGPQTSEVGLLKPNRFGLHDMHGNVYEWCADFYAPDAYAKTAAKDPAGPDHGDERVLRGGAWESDAAHCRSANRNGFAPASKGYLLGFRVAMPVENH